MAHIIMNMLASIVHITQTHVSRYSIVFGLQHLQRIKTDFNQGSDTRLNIKTDLVDPA